MITLGMRRSGPVPPPPWQDPVIDFAALLETSLIVSVAIIASVVAVIRLLPERWRLPCIVFAVPCALYPTMPLDSRLPSWVLSFGRLAVVDGPMYLIVMSSLLGAATLLTLTAWRSGDPVAQRVGRALGFVVLPIATTWAVYVALAGTYLGDRYGPSGVWYAVANLVALCVVIPWAGATDHVGSATAFERAVRWRSSASSARRFPLVAAQFGVWACGPLLALALLASVAQAAQFIDMQSLRVTRPIGLVGVLARWAWLLIALVVVGRTSVRLLHDERRFMPCRCHACGYDLRGQRDDDEVVCPECGAAYAQGSVAMAK